MAISYTVPNEYEFDIFYGAATSVSNGASSVALTPRNMNPAELLSFTRKHEDAPIPEGDGALMISDGHFGAETIDFYGAMYGDDQEDTFSSLAIRLNTIANATQYCYLRAGLWNGATKDYFRRYGVPLHARVPYVPGARYAVVNGFEMQFRVLDPFWYSHSAHADVISVVAGVTGNVVTVDTGIARSLRLRIQITKTGGGNPTNVIVKNAALDQFQMIGSLVGVNDFWTIDMHAHTVKKTVGGVTTDDIANFVGRFWGIKNGSDTITATSTVNSSFDVDLAWLERRF